MNGYICPVIDVKKTGKRIQELREQNGMSVRTLQEILGFSSPQAIYKWQWGQALPDIANLIFLARLWHVNVENILVLANEDVFLFLCYFFLRYAYSHRKSGWPGCSLPKMPVRTVSSSGNPSSMAANLSSVM